MAEFTLQTLHKKLLKQLPKTIIMGEPLESPLAKAADQFRFQVMLRSPNPRAMTNYVRSIMDELTVPDEVVTAVDVDPLFLS
jgi:primosomal protein N'